MSYPLLPLGNELAVDRIGYGAMRLVGAGNWGPPDDPKVAVGVLRRAVELGATFIDTAEAYGPGISESLIAEALYPYPESLVIATKGGVIKMGPGKSRLDGSPSSLRTSVEASLHRLRLEQIDLYQLHIPDPNVPIVESVGALEELRQEGKIRLIGLSNVSLDEYAEARTVATINTVQNRYNLTDRSSESVLHATVQHGAVFIPYNPLNAKTMFQSAPLALDIGSHADVARRLGVKPGQVALAWLLHRSSNILLIPGTTSIVHLEENLAAGEIQLTSNDMTALTKKHDR